MCDAHAECRECYRDVGCFWCEEGSSCRSLVQLPSCASPAATCDCWDRGSCARCSARSDCVWTEGTRLRFGDVRSPAFDGCLGGDAFGPERAPMLLPPERWFWRQCALPGLWCFLALFCSGLASCTACLCAYERRRSRAHERLLLNARSPLMHDDAPS